MNKKLNSVQDKKSTAEDNMTQDEIADLFSLESDPIPEKKDAESTTPVKETVPADICPSTSDADKLTQEKIADLYFSKEEDQRNVSTKYVKDSQPMDKPTAPKPDDSKLTQEEITDLYFPKSKAEQIPEESRSASSTPAEDADSADKPPASKPDEDKSANGKVTPPSAAKPDDEKSETMSSSLVAQPDLSTRLPVLIPEKNAKPKKESIPEYKITPILSDHGTISPATAQTVKQGSDITFTLMPNKGYFVDTFKVDGTETPLTDNRYAFKNVTADHAMEAVFEAYVDEYNMLKNGKVGQEYSDVLDLRRIHPNGEIGRYTVKGLKKIGLTIDYATGKITGTPKIAGNPGENFEFELVIRYKIENGKKERKRIFMKVLPDPKRLWKTLEPPPDAKDRKAHEYHKRIRLAEDGKGRIRTIICASKRGRSHAHKALFRDDHVKIKHLKDSGWSLIAAADGAGSAELSRVGSAIACETAVDFVARQIREKNDEIDTKIRRGDEKIIRNMLYHLIAAAGFESAKAIQKEAQQRGAEIRAFSTTLLLTIHKKFDFGNFFAGFCVGDGVLAVYTREKGATLLGVPDGGEFSGETVFVTMNRIMTPQELAKRIHYTVVDDFTALIAMTDGVSDPKFGTDRNLEKISLWDNLWDELKKKVLDTEAGSDVRLLEWLDFWAEGEHDDRTIALLF